MSEKYIKSGREIVCIKDRANSITPYRRSARWIVWSITAQAALSEHATRKAALAALSVLA